MKNVELGRGGDKHKISGRADIYIYLIIEPKLTTFLYIVWSFTWKKDRKVYHKTLLWATFCRQNTKRNIKQNIFLHCVSDNNVIIVGILIDLMLLFFFLFPSFFFVSDSSRQESLHVHPTKVGYTLH